MHEMHEVLCNDAGINSLTSRKNVNLIIFFIQLMRGIVDTEQLLSDIKFNPSDNRLRNHTPFLYSNINNNNANFVCKSPIALMVTLINLLYRNTQLRNRMFNFDMNISTTFIHSCVQSSNIPNLINYL